MKSWSWIIRNANLWVDNDEPLYRRKQSWVENAKRKIINATYRRDLLIPAIEKYLVPEVLRVMKQYGELEGEGPVPKMVKRAIATSITRSIEYEARQEARGHLDKPSMVKKRGFILAARGYHGIIRKPTRFLVGEGGRAERVNITPLYKSIYPGRKKTKKGMIHQNGIKFPNINIRL
jgi:hypothetical protein